jgi:RimJ/RimL family protein N-acetyltransferase
MSSVENSDRNMPGEEVAVVVPIELVSSDGEIRLKQYTPEDARAAYNLIRFNERHLSQFGDTTGSKYKDEDDFRKSITDPENPDKLRFGIWNKDGRLVGSINLTPDKENPTVGVIGYYLARMDTGKDITRRAVETLTDYAFNQKGYTELIGNVHKNNVGSAKVLHNVGFQFETAGQTMIKLSRKKNLPKS